MFFDDIVCGRPQTSFENNCGFNLSEDKVDNTIYTVGCFTAFENAILDNMKIAIGVGIGVGLILVVGILIAFLEMKNPKDPMG